MPLTRRCRIAAVTLATVAAASLGAASLQGGSRAAVRDITVHEGTNLAVTASPDGRDLVMDLQGVLWSLPRGGGEARRLTDGLLEPARPDFSPRGDLVAFQAYAGGTFHIWTMRPDGTEVRQLTSGHGDDREPRFSPDGTRIAFSSDRAFEGSYDVWVVDVATGALTRWTESSVDEFEPAWAPDGGEIALVSGAGSNGPGERAPAHRAAPRRASTPRWKAATPAVVLRSATPPAAPNVSMAPRTVTNTTTGASPTAIQLSTLPAGSYT